MEEVIAIAIGVLAASGVWLILRPRTFQVVMGLTLTGESLNDLSDPRLRLRRRAKAGSGAVTSTSVIAAQQAAAA